MQLRKLIRLLKEAEKKHGSRIECCIDTRFAKGQANKDVEFVSIPNVQERQCVWNEELTETEHWRTVLVLGVEIGGSYE